MSKWSFSWRFSSGIICPLAASPFSVFLCFFFIFTPAGGSLCCFMRSAHTYYILSGWSRVVGWLECFKNSLERTTCVLDQGFSSLYIYIPAGKDNIISWDRSLCYTCPPVKEQQCSGGKRSRMLTKMCDSAHMGKITRKNSAALNAWW